MQSKHSQGSELTQYIGPSELDGRILPDEETSSMTHSPYIKRQYDSNQELDDSRRTPLYIF
jgi:hypothetical protein